MPRIIRLTTSRLIQLAALSLTLIPAFGFAIERVGDFSLLDHEGLFHSMRWYDDHTAVALLVQANGSADTRAALSEFQTLKDKYEKSGIEFMMINPMGRLDRKSLQLEAKTLGIDMPILMDDTRVVSEALGIAHLGEVLIFNPRAFTVEYHGDVSGVEQAITELLAKKPVSVPNIASKGTPVGFAELAAVAQAGVSYEKDIAPMLAENCANCHRAGGIAPFAMDSHAMIQGWSPMIREVVMTKRMPPGQIDSHVGKFSNSRVLKDAEVQKLLVWIEAGAPKDGMVDPLAQLRWPSTKWANGEPDLVLKVPEQHVPATGVLEYRFVDIPIDLGGKDRWLRGSEYIAGDPSVLHHMVNDLLGPGQGRRDPSHPDQGSITAYVPGNEARMEEENTGGLLLDGSVLKLNLHYTTNGKETVDRSEIGLYFYPEGVIPAERMSGRCACIFTPTWTNIPPHHPAFEQRESITVENDAHLYTLYPHMHFRGKSMRFEAEYPDGSMEELLNVANFNYNWQLFYAFEEPKFVPAGTRINAIGTFDNSAQNPANPDPDRSVPWGEQSWDEMFFGSVRWKNVDQSQTSSRRLAGQ
jgi:mono/diheme cytochrome c family protein